MFHISKIPHQKEAQVIPKSVMDPGRMAPEIKVVVLNWKPDNSPTIYVCVFFPSSQDKEEP